MPTGPRCDWGLLSWPTAEMLDKRCKMEEEEADASSAGPLGVCLFSDNQN